MLVYFVMIVVTIQDLFSQTQNHVEFPKNQNIPDIPSRCLEFSFSIKGLSNFSNFLKGG